MPEKEIDVFIQNLKDKTTVLQQLLICIDEIKTIINNTDSLSEDFIEYKESTDIALELINNALEDIQNTHIYRKNIILYVG